MTGSSPEDNETNGSDGFNASDGSDRPDSSSGSKESDEAAWQAIIEGLGPLTLPPDDSPSTDASPNIADSASEPATRRPSSWRGPDDEQRSLADLFNDDHLGLTQADDDDLEDTFTPPDPGPILDGDPLLTMAWFGAVGGPLILFILAVFWRSAPSFLFWGAGVLALAGLAILLWRMPHSRDIDDFDDGARV